MSEQRVTKSELQQWRDHFITKEFINMIDSFVIDVSERLSYTAGIDQVEDNFRRGYIQGLRDIRNFRLDDEQLPEED